jgi:hypothetical protein
MYNKLSAFYTLNIVQTVQWILSILYRKYSTGCTYYTQQLCPVLCTSENVVRTVQNKTAIKTHRRNVLNTLILLYFWKFLVHEESRSSGWGGGGANTVTTREKSGSRELWRGLYSESSVNAIDRVHYMVTRLLSIWCTRQITARQLLA